MKLTLNQRYFFGAAAVILACLAGILVAYPKLPAMVPIHWNIHGRADNFGPKWTLFLWGPGMMLGFVALFAALPWLSPRKFDVNTFRPTYLYIMIVLIAMLAYVNLLTLMAGLGAVTDVGRAVVGGVCLLIALLGNVFGKVRRNFYIGIRTPWTIASERVWNKTHRLAGKMSFACGLLGLILILAHAPVWLALVVAIAGPIVPAFYSLFYYKQLEHRGELNHG